MDHDSVSGLREFAAAGRIAGLPVTGGAEVRASFLKTPFAGHRINNTDQDGNAYIALHGIAEPYIDQVDAFLAPLRVKRNYRNSRMCERINQKVGRYGITLDFEKDVMPLSQYKAGGSITERHLLYALAGKLIDSFGPGEKLIDFIENALGISVTNKAKTQLSDPENPIIQYDILAALKSDMGFFYIPADEECADIRDIIKLSKDTNSIAAYAYLGDVEVSVTGDKRAQRFEDSYLDEFFDYLKEIGISAVTYMPSRNTQAQLKRVRKLCSDYGFMQISGEDINNPRQEFVCKALRNPEYANLADSSWALIGHEHEVQKGLEYGFFGEKTVNTYRDIDQRTRAFANIAKNIYKTK